MRLLSSCRTLLLVFSLLSWGCWRSRARRVGCLETAWYLLDDGNFLCDLRSLPRPAVLHHFAGRSKDWVAEPSWTRLQRRPSFARLLILLYIFSYILRCSPIAYIYSPIFPLYSPTCSVILFTLLYFSVLPQSCLSFQLFRGRVCQVPRISCWRLLGWHVATLVTVCGSSRLKSAMTIMTSSLPDLPGGAVVFSWRNLGGFTWM